MSVNAVKSKWPRLVGAGHTPLDIVPCLDNGVQPAGGRSNPLILSCHHRLKYADAIGWMEYHVTPLVHGVSSTRRTIFDLVTYIYNVTYIVNDNKLVCVCSWHLATVT